MNSNSNDISKSNDTTHLPLECFSATVRGYEIDYVVRDDGCIFAEVDGLRWVSHSEHQTWCLAPEFEFFDALGRLGRARGMRSMQFWDLFQEILCVGAGWLTPDERSNMFAWKQLKERSAAARRRGR